MTKNYIKELVEFCLEHEGFVPRRYGNPHGYELHFSVGVENSKPVVSCIYRHKINKEKFGSETIGFPTWCNLERLKVNTIFD